MIEIDHKTMGQTCGILPVGIDSAHVKTEGLKWNLGKRVIGVAWGGAHRQIGRRLSTAMCQAPITCCLPSQSSISPQISLSCGASRSSRICRPWSTQNHSGARRSGSSATRALATTSRKASRSLRSAWRKRRRAWGARWRSFKRVRVSEPLRRRRRQVTGTARGEAYAPKEGVEEAGVDSGSARVLPSWRICSRACCIQASE